MTAEPAAVEPRYNSPLYAMTPCPPWCVRDHADGAPDHRTAHREIRGFRSRPYDSIGAHASDPLPAISTGPKVRLHGYRAWPLTAHPYMSLDAEGAENLALLVEMLAGATAAQHRTLAAALRAAAAAINAGGAE